MAFSVGQSPRQRTTICLVSWVTKMWSVSVLLLLLTALTEKTSLATPEADAFAFPGPLPEGRKKNKTKMERIGIQTSYGKSGLFGKISCWLKANLNPEQVLTGPSFKEGNVVSEVHKSI